MPIRAVEPRIPSVHDHFGRFAAFVSSWLGSTWAFVAAGLIIAAWAATGPVFHFSDRWAEVISTGATLLTFLMVMLIQNTQNRDARAINLKLNELIRAADKAGNHMIDIERLTDMELDQMQLMYEKVRTAWTERQSRSAQGPGVK
jgi:low affinity Fe/Cu permease